MTRVGREEDPPHSVAIRDSERLATAVSLFAHPFSQYHTNDCIVMTFSCIRIETAMEADIQRLESECRLYRNATRDERTRQASQLRAIQSSYNNNADPTNSNNNDDALANMEQTLRDEMERLAAVCQEEEAELENLGQLELEAAAVAKQLDALQWSINEEANALELETHASENEEQQILTVLTEVQTEVDRLSSKGIRFPSRALGLRVDARGLRYPLINELRLAYRPKGDVDWEEIQSAWALAAQLLLQSATLLQFQSQHWRIVPLSQCAKIIYHAPNSENNRGVTQNVGHPSSKSSEALMAWNALLFEVVQHAKTTIKAGIEKGLLEAKTMERLPYEQTSQSIGGVPLRHLAVDDDASWSRVVHFMSCNLLWLANTASLWTLEDVILSAVDL